MSLQQRRHERQGEVTVDDGRDAGEDLESWLQPAPQACGGILAQEDGSEQPYGQRHGYRDGRRQERAADERQDAVVGLGPGEGGRPLGRGQELDDGDFAEEPEGLEDQDQDDAEGRQDREVGAGREHELHDVLPEVSTAALPPHPGLRPHVSSRLNRHSSEPPEIARPKPCHEQKIWGRSETSPNTTSETSFDNHPHCDCSSAVCRSPPFGWPSASMMVPVVRSSHCWREAFSMPEGSVTYLAASTSWSSFSPLR